MRKGLYNLDLVFILLLVCLKVFVDKWRYCLGGCVGVWIGNLSLVFDGFV